MIDEILEHYYTNRKHNKLNHDSQGGDGTTVGNQQLTVFQAMVDTQPKATNRRVHDSNFKRRRMNGNRWQEGKKGNPQQQENREKGDKRCVSCFHNNYPMKVVMSHNLSECKHKREKVERHTQQQSETRNQNQQSVQAHWVTSEEDEADAVSDFIAEAYAEARERVIDDDNR